MCSGRADRATPWLAAYWTKNLLAPETRPEAHLGPRESRTGRDLCARAEWENQKGSSRIQASEKGLATICSVYSG